MTIVLPYKHYNGQHRAAETEETKEHPEKRSQERNEDSRIQVQLQEDGGDRTRQS